MEFAIGFLIGALIGIVLTLLAGWMIIFVALRQIVERAIWKASQEILFQSKPQSS